MKPPVLRVGRRLVGALNPKSNDGLSNDGLNFTAAARADLMKSSRTWEAPGFRISLNGNAAKVVWPARRSTYRIAGPLGELLVRLRHSRSLGSLSVNGDLHVVVYDIPGLFDRSAGAAGGFVWFREEARAALPGATDFQLVSTSGARVRGRVVQRHGLSAAVVIEPTVVTRTKSETPYGEGRFAPAAIAGSGDNELVRRSGLLTVQGT